MAFKNLLVGVLVVVVVVVVLGFGDVCVCVCEEKEKRQQGDRYVRIGSFVYVAHTLIYHLYYTMLESITNTFTTSNDDEEEEEEEKKTEMKTTTKTNSSLLESLLSRDTIVSNESDGKDVSISSSYTDMICFFMLGMSAWWCFNTVTSLTPIYTSCKDRKQIVGSDTSACSTYVVPEGVEFSSYSNVAAQLGNLFPFVYRILIRHVDTNRHRMMMSTVGGSLFFGLGTLTLLLFDWNETDDVFGRRHSVVLLIACFVSGGLGCLSSVIYWQVAAGFHANCVRSMSLGMATGGLVPMSLALIQNWDVGGGDDDDDDEGVSPSAFDPRWTFGASACVQLMFIVVFFRIWKRRATSVESDRTIDGASVTLVEREKKTIATSTSVVSVNESMLIMFVVYFAAYALPSFVPIMISSYGDSKMLYTAINVSYTAGDVVGRLCGALTKRLFRYRHTNRILCTIVVGLFIIQITSSYFHRTVATDVLPGASGYLFALLQFSFYACRGFVVTQTYTRAKESCTTRENAEILAGRLGSTGQVGAAVGAFLSFALISLAHTTSPSS